MGFEIAHLTVNLSDYTLSTYLGKGTFGAAYLATRAGSDEQVAVKLAFEELESDNQVSFIRELQILAKNEHPATLRLLGFSLSPYPDRDERGPVLITTLMANGSLESALKKARSKAPPWWTPTVKSKIVFGIAAGMDYVHNQQVMHRDLKPDNIFLDANYEPVIADFGLSRSFNGDVLQQTLQIGSPLFMAPEIISAHESPGTRQYDFRVDVYSYAMILYALFNRAQTPSYEGGGRPKTIAELTRHVTSGRRYAKLPEIPEFYWGLIEDCWKPGWESRPHFREIVDTLRKDHAYALEGADIAQLIEYEDRLLAYRDAGRLDLSGGGLIGSDSHFRISGGRTRLKPKIKFP
jgi:serine/threonine protein kinase